MSGNENKESEFKNLSKETPFVVPESYFDDFSDRLSKRIEGEAVKSVQKKTIKLKSFFNPQLSIAASLILFAVLSYFTITLILNSDTKEDSSIYFAELVESEIEDYDLYLIMEVIEENTYLDDEEYDSKEDDEIINYLVSEEIDIEEIIVEL